jgi:hypothetical protein
MTHATKKWVGAGVAITAILVLVAMFYRGVPSTSYPFPCVTGTLSYHWHTQLTITDRNGAVTIPANVGFSAACAEPVHTHDTSGLIHVESDTSRTYTLGDFLLVWGKPFGSPSQMVVNGSPVSPSAAQPLQDQETISLTYAGTFG